MVSAIHAGGHMADYINTIERAIIDQLRTDFPGVTVFGQYPEPEDVKYPCIVLEQLANGAETQFMGQRVSFGGEAKKGEIYGAGFRFHLIVDRFSKMSIVPDGESSTEVYKQRRLLNYIMLNVANTLMDIEFPAAKVDILERHFGGWTDVGYLPSLELWGSSCVMLITFENYRSL